MMSSQEPTPSSAQAPMSTRRWRDYVQLMRLDKPIGTLLLLWPTLWALWLAAEGVPDIEVLGIFIAGVILMRAAGCVINDYADRNFDAHVERTRQRPLAQGRIPASHALGLFVVLVLAAFGLVLMTNALTVYLSFGALALAACYPFMKRHTHLPQVVLGAAFAWSIPMAWAAQTSNVPTTVWLLYTVTVLWTVAYDTLYAMVDREDDLKIGIKSTAILFGSADRSAIGVLQILVVLGLVLVGEQAELGFWYFCGVIVAALLFVYQQHMIRLRYREDCFRAFLNNQWVGLAVFVGLALDYL